MLIFLHVYDRKRPERYYRDHDNIELNSVVDAVVLYFLHDDGPTQCRHYYCMAVDDQERTEVFLVPRSEFDLWLLREKDLETLGKNLLPLLLAMRNKSHFYRRILEIVQNLLSSIRKNGKHIKHRKT